MAVTPVQINNNENNLRTYRDASVPMNTSNNVKPLPPQGHLVHDRIMSMPRFFFKDISYDIQAVKDGIKGTANDHQTGCLNDVGLKVGGVGIATYLAAKTSNPVARVMEYAGLGAFLAAMSIYPKLAIQVPSRALHGFDSGKEYIDDQGRKKSVFQDPNYIPFDMYQGEYPDEDLDVIGDRLGVPREIQNRHELVKEQMRKIATQNNTLWMLSAGFATPVIAAMMCYGLEKLIAPAIEDARNTSHNAKISYMLKQTEKMMDKEPAQNSMSRQVSKILKKYDGNELPKEKFEKITEILTKNVDAHTSQGIKDDLTNILKGDEQVYTVDKKTIQQIFDIKNNISVQKKEVFEKIFPNYEKEIQMSFTKLIGNFDALVKIHNDSSNIEEFSVTEEQLRNFKQSLKEKAMQGLKTENKAEQEFLNDSINEITNNIVANIKKNPSNTVNEEKINNVTEMAKILGEFKNNQKVLDSCKHFKFEYDNETVLARSYSKFENTLLDVLDIKFKDLKVMRESDKITKDILEQRLNALAKDDKKYEKAIKRLSKSISEMEVALNGKDAADSHVKDLISAIENNYNNTAKRLNNVNGHQFRNTIDKLVKEDVNTLSNTIVDRKDLFEILDGVKPELSKDGIGEIGYAKQNAKGVGSAKRMEIDRIIQRYQGTKNSMYRMLHAMDSYKRFPENADEVAKVGKDAILTATSSEITQKLYTVNSPEFYKKIMYTVWDENKVSDATKNAMGSEEDLSHGDVLNRFKKYIKRFKDIMGDNDVDFTKPHHKTFGSQYSADATTPMSKFNLCAQSPVDFLQKAAERKYGTSLWMRRVSIIGAAVLGGTLLAQLGFGKIRNPHNIKKQVSDDSSK